MKLLLFVLALALCHTSIAQNPPQKINANYQFQSLGGDSSLRLPKSKAVNHNLRDTGMIYYNRSDKKIHWTIDSLTDVTFSGAAPGLPVTSLQFNNGPGFSGRSNFVVDTINTAIDLNGNGTSLAQSILSFFDNIPATVGSPTQRNWVTISPIDSGGGTPPFFITESATRYSGSAQADNVINWGWNMSPGGGVQIAGQPGIGYSLEQTFNPTAGDTTVEAHLFYLRRGSGQQDRLFSYTIDQHDNVYNFYHTANQWALRAPNFRTGGTNNYVFLTAAPGNFNIDGNPVDTIAGNQGFHIQNDTTSGTQFSQTGTGPNQLIMNSFGAISLPGEFNSAGFIRLEGTSSKIFEPATDSDWTIGQVSNRFFLSYIANQITNNMWSELSTHADGHSTPLTLNCNNNSLPGEVSIGTQATNNDTVRMSVRTVIGDNNPNASALLTLHSTTQGFLMPAMSDAQKSSIGLPANGLQVYDTDQDAPSYYSSTQANFLNWGEVKINIFTPSSGGTVNIVRGSMNVINPSGSLSSLTINMPTGVTPNDFLEIKITQAITTITFTGATTVDPISSSGAAAYYKYVWHGSSWF